MSKKNISRRMFLKGSGGATLAIPLLQSLLPREAWAQSVGPTKRYFNFVGSYDYGHHQHWFPTLNRLTQRHTPVNGDQAFEYQALNTLISTTSTNDLSFILGNKMNPLINKMNIFRGLNLHSRIAHGSGHMLGNIRATDGHDPNAVLLKALPTIDQVLAKSRKFTPHTSDPFLIGSESFSYQKDSTGLITRASRRTSQKPHVLFDTLFAGVNESGQTTTTPAHPRRDILTRVLEDYQRVIGGRVISAGDKNVLNNIMDQISDIQRRLPSSTTTSIPGCGYSNINVSTSRTDGLFVNQYNIENHAYAYEMYARIMAAAASCDLFRVFQYHTGPGPFDRHPTEDFHQGHSHAPWTVIPENNNRINHVWMAQIWRFYVDNFLAPLALALNSIPDTNGNTLLDNSIVHMTLESSTVHSDMNKPCLMIGKAGSALNTGYLIDYSRYDLGPHARQGDLFNGTPSDSRFGHCYHGIHYNRSLTTILRAMGLSGADYEDPTINQLFTGRSDSLLGSQNNGITNVGGYGHIGSDVSSLYASEYSRHNYHFYKEMLPLPPSSMS